MFEKSLRECMISMFQMEQKMENYRQLLNEEIQFNLSDLYLQVCGRSSMVTAYHLQSFIQQPESSANVKLLESMIKVYNNGTSMNLTFIEFSLIFLSRQNKLLAKLSLERNSLGQIPNYLISYARKILLLECQLHKTLSQFRLVYSFEAQQWIRQNMIFSQQKQGEQFDKKVIESICRSVQIDSEVVMRSIRLNGNKNEPIQEERMMALFTLKNCHSVEEFLKNKQKKRGKTLQSGEVDAFLRPEFHDCLDRPRTTDLFSHREMKSIQKHLSRLNGKNKIELTDKITEYRTLVEKQLRRACEAIKQILWLEKEIEYQRIELCLCTDFYPVLFFDSLEKDRENLLIPSAMKEYLQKFGISMEINNFYLLFKRYSSRTDGKLSFNQFCSIFDVCNTDYTHIHKNRQVKSLEDVEIETKKNFLKLIKLIIKNELKIEKIKAKLQEQVNLRDIFNCFDADEDGCISQLDIKIGFKKFLLMDLSNQEAELMWYRMKVPHADSKMIKYERFIAQMTPKSQWVSRKKVKTLQN